MERRQTETHGWPPEEGLELGLERLEPLGRDDRLLVDEVALDGREHFLVGHLRGPEDGEAGEHEGIRREQVPQELQGRPALEQPLACHLVEAGNRRERARFEEPDVQLDAKVALETGLGVVHGEGERVVVHVERHAVVGAQDRVVGVEESPASGQLGVRVQPALEEAALVEQEPPEARRRMHGAQLEGDRRGPVVLLPGRRREDQRHEDLDQVAVALERGRILDRRPELGHPLEATTDRPGHVARDAGLGGLGLPGGDQGREAQLAPERERGRRELEPETRLGRGRHLPVHAASAASRGEARRHRDLWARTCRARHPSGYHAEQSGPAAAGPPLTGRARGRSAPSGCRPARSRRSARPDRPR